MRIFQQPIRFIALACALAALVMSTARAQEFLDTAGRWKQLSFGDDPIQARPWTMAASSRAVYVGREKGSLLVSRDSGETWRELKPNLPEGVEIIYSVTWVDSLREPEHIAAVVAYGARSEARAGYIESLDGGATWTHRAWLPSLDAFVRRNFRINLVQGPPSLHFVDRDPRSAFIYSGQNLLATTDAGDTWEVRVPFASFRALSMTDRRHGMAVIGDTADSRSDWGVPAHGIYRTSDGGTTWTLALRLPQSATFYQNIGFHRHGPTDVTIIGGERPSNFMSYWIFTTTDNGATWESFQGFDTRRPIVGTAIFRGPEDVHLIIDGAIILHSPDGGRSLYMLRDTTPAWFYSVLDVTQHTESPVTGTDGTYIYLSIQPDVIVRWRMAPVSPMSRVDRPHVSRPPALHVVPNVIDDRRVRVELSDAIPHGATLRLVDAAGRTVWSGVRRARETHVTIELGDAAAGRYHLVATTDQAHWSATILVR